MSKPLGDFASISLDRLRSLTSRALVAHGLAHDAASTIAGVVADAERDGAKSHGLFRVPGFAFALRRWRESANSPVVRDTAPGLVSVDARGGFAAPALEAGKALLVAKARSQGVAALEIHRTRHFSALWWEVEALASEGLVALAFVNRSFLRVLRGLRLSRKYVSLPPPFFFLAQPSSHMLAGEETECMERTRWPSGVLEATGGRHWSLTRSHSYSLGHRLSSRVY